MTTGSPPWRTPWRYEAFASADQETVRLHNLALVLRQVYELGPRSRATIAAATGLNKGTVSRLVAELIDHGLLRETGMRPGAVGRPAQVLALDGAGLAGVGLGIDADSVAVAARDLAGRELGGARRAFDVGANSAEATLDVLIGMTRELFDAIDAAGAVVVGIGVSVPGLVDVGRGVVTTTPNLNATWRNLPLASWLRTALGEPAYPVQIENDANLSALAEYWEEPDAGARNVVHVSGFFGIGGAAIVDGRLMRGADGFSGEFGHMVLDVDGPRCGCGRAGCWEALAGLGAVLRRLYPDGLAPDGRVRNPEESIATIVDRARRGDEETLAVLADVGRWLGIGAANLVNIFNPDVLVFSGYFAELAPWLLDVSMSQLRDRVLAPALGGTRVRFSSLGAGAAVRGGAAVAIQELVSNPGRLIADGGKLNG
jgi:predicted NBD/HSP70 family sugar kinase